jgi:hypothetical protein
MVYVVYSRNVTLKNHSSRAPIMIARILSQNWTDLSKIIVDTNQISFVIPFNYDFSTEQDILN